MIDLKKILVLASSLACICIGSADAASSKSTIKTGGGDTFAGQTKKAPELQEAKTGTRFVMSKSAGASLPSTLYYRGPGGFYYKVSMNSRLPGMRLAYPAGGSYYFWEKDPTPKPVATKAGEPAVKVETPRPDLIVRVPEGVGSRSLCILQPVDKESASKKTKYSVISTYLSEADLPKLGQSILNLSKYPLYLMISEKGDFTDKKQILIKGCTDMSNISSSNFYNFQGNSGQKISFILSYKIPTQEDPIRLKASSLVLSGKQVQIAVVLTDKGAKKPSVKMENIQIMRK